MHSCIVKIELETVQLKQTSIDCWQKVGRSRDLPENVGSNCKHTPLSLSSHTKYILPHLWTFVWSNWVTIMNAGRQWFVDNRNIKDQFLILLNLDASSHLMFSTLVLLLCTCTYIHVYCCNLKNLQYFMPLDSDSSLLLPPQFSP